MIPENKPTAIWPWLVVGALLFFGSAKSPVYAFTAQEVPVEDRAVLQAALSPLAAHYGMKYLVVASQPRRPVIERDWLAAQFMAAGKKEAASRLDQLLTSYEGRNLKEHLPTDWGTPNIKVIEAQSLTSMFSGDVLGGWRRFWAEFPGAAALLDLSLPGYSIDQSWALVCYTLSRGSLASEVWVALLRREEGSWKVEWREILVQS